MTGPARLHGTKLSLMVLAPLAVFVDGMSKIQIGLFQEDGKAGDRTLHTRIGSCT